MNNWKRCENGHFYDGDKYTSCPYCSKAESGSGVTVSMDGGPAGRQSLGDGGEQTVSLEEAVSAAAGTGPSPAADDNSKTVSYYSNAIGTEPVVGWLVCTEGEYFGESFKLKSGRNFIGRDSSMDIVLGGDITVSRERHAIIVYEPKARLFIAQPGDSRELFYVNDAVVLNNVQLKNNDVLSIGNTKLMLITCCNEHFCWEDVKPHN